VTKLSLSQISVIAARRWRFLVVGANNEDEARELAEQIRQGAAPGATVHAERADAFVPFMPF